MVGALLVLTYQPTHYPPPSATHYPRLTPGLHAQYVEIVTSHVELDLDRHLASVSGGPPWASADLWAALAQACRRAALDGRCDAGPSPHPNPSPSPYNPSPNPNPTLSPRPNSNPNPSRPRRQVRREARAAAAPARRGRGLRRLLRDDEPALAAAARAGGLTPTLTPTAIPTLTPALTLPLAPAPTLTLALTRTLPLAKPQP